jgi:hypothetical protein
LHFFREGDAELNSTTSEMISISVIGSTSLGQRPVPRDAVESLGEGGSPSKIKDSLIDSFTSVC